MSLLSRTILRQASSAISRATSLPPSPTLTQCSTNNTFQLPDNRTLGYALYGDPHGTPVFLFHGSPSCRLEAADWHAAALRRKIRIIGIDRWGMGLSSFKPQGRILDWPEDVSALASHLRLAKFHVMGGSGGGPYALACAALLPKSMLVGTGVVAGAAPPEAGTKGVSWDRWVAFKLNIWLPRAVLKWMMDTTLGNVARSGDVAAFEKQMNKVIATFSAGEREILEQNPQFRKDFVESFREASRTGCDGAVLDAKLVLSPWGFGMSEVHGRVRIWNGTADVHVPVHSARWMVERLPDADLKVYEGESHMGLPLHHGEEILADLIELGEDL
ncbi:alpha/beta-hydrolase [Periconia macrospinosa]|uniref:Alpha/beta-hydrolase n=1 Tax=Periconia macrospinosa TaxID=97972 RepID=A0A2V1E5Q4_9PLEO|nr:alpha/beta-hydrolase [Periconia macrospinosa]